MNNSTLFAPETRTAQLTIVLRDLDALQTVCRRRGWEFRAGQQTYRWFGRWLNGAAPAELGRCTHAIGVPGCLYEIGLAGNDQRQDLSPLDQARAYDLGMRQFGFSIRELAGRLGRERRWTWLTGMRFLDAVERAGPALKARRPAIGLRDVPALLWRTARWQQRKSPRRPTSRMMSQSSSLVSSRPFE